MKSKNNKKKNKTKRKKIGGHFHLNENRPHYHLMIKYPTGRSKEMYELFERTGEGKDSIVNSGKVKDIMDYVEYELGIPSTEFTLFWNGKKLNNPNLKIRKIIVNGERIRLYNFESNPIIVVLNNKDKLSDNKLSSTNYDSSRDTI